MGLTPQQIEQFRVILSGLLDIAFGVDAVYVSLYKQHGHPVVYHQDIDCHAPGVDERIITTRTSLRRLEPRPEACIDCVKRGASNGSTIPDDSLGNAPAPITRGAASRDL